MDFEGRKPLEGGINLVPLINIVFLLLIFFMLSSTLVTPDRFNVDLPESADAQSSEADPISVLISADGALAVNNEPVDLGDLEPAISQLLLERPDSGVLVKADAGATTAQVVNVLRRARAAGVERVALATQGAAP